MIKLQVSTPYHIHSENRLLQGDILKDISYFIGDLDDTKSAESVSIPYGIILTQDCDLSEDFKSRENSESDNDKELKTVLVCPCYEIETFANGHQIAKKQMQTFGKKQLNKIMRNDEYKRYHFLVSNDKIPNLVIDFKHFYTIDRDLIYKKRSKNYVCTLGELFRENVSQRFTNFLGRIGLPEVSIEE